MQYNLGEFTIGADPEAFVIQDGKYKAVQHFITGTKENPQPLPQGGNAQCDNVAIEFGVVPAKNKLEFVQNIGDTLEDLINALPEGVSIDVIPSVDFPMEELTHPDAKKFGCDPDFNAWTMKVNEPPKDAADHTFRSAGGHIHIGYVEHSGNDFLKDIEGKAMTIRICDCILGLIATVLDDSGAAKARRQLYGKAGCCRWTDYGVEYRTLSNFWIKSPKLVELMYSLVEDVLRIMRTESFMDIILDLGAREVQRIITDGDAQAAFELIQEVVMNYLNDNSIELFWDIYNFKNEEMADLDILKAWKEII